MKNNKQNKIRKIADHYEIGEQLRQCTEDCAELIAILDKYQRFLSRDYKFNSCKWDPDNNLHVFNMDEISSDIADVKIMVKQIEYLLNDEYVVKLMINEKLDKWLNLIKNEENSK